MELTHLEKIRIARNNLTGEFEVIQKDFMKNLKNIEETFKIEKVREKEIKKAFEYYNTWCIIYERDLKTLRIR